MANMRWLSEKRLANPDSRSGVRVICFFGGGVAGYKNLIPRETADPSPLCGKTNQAYREEKHEARRSLQDQGKGSKKDRR